MTAHGIASHRMTMTCPDMVWYGLVWYSTAWYSNVKSSHVLYSSSFIKDIKIKDDTYTLPRPEKRRDEKTLAPRLDL